MTVSVPVIVIGLAIAAFIVLVILAANASPLTERGRREERGLCLGGFAVIAVIVVVLFFLP